MCDAPINIDQFVRDVSVLANKTFYANANETFTSKYRCRDKELSKLFSIEQKIEEQIIFACSARLNREWADDIDKPLPTHRHSKYVNMHGNIIEVTQRNVTAYVTCAPCVQRLRAGQSEHCLTNVCN
jgi:hypothetical protein